MARYELIEFEYALYSKALIVHGAQKSGAGLVG